VIIQSPRVSAQGAHRGGGGDRLIIWSTLMIIVLARIGLSTS